VFGANWNWQTFDFDYDVAKVDHVLGPIANANSVDLNTFRAHGGKFLAYHGWADDLVPTQDHIDYFLRLAASLQTSPGDTASGIKAAQTFLRLFLAPGQGHCLATGPGPNVFGGADNPGGPADAAHNVLLALQAWVEQGIAPTKVIATKYVNDDPAMGVKMTRPLCVFPQIARYKGTGSTNDAANFTCVDDGVTTNPMAAPPYLRD
jgi:feruloyl esterase